MEKHLAHIAFGKPVGSFHGNQAALDGALLHALVINASSIIFDFNINMVAAMISAQCNFAGLRFTCRGAVAAQLDSMGDRVADKMDERVRNLLDDIVVEFGLASREV